MQPQDFIKPSIVYSGKQRDSIDRGGAHAFPSASPRNTFNSICLYGLTSPAFSLITFLVNVIFLSEYFYTELLFNIAL